MKPSSMACRMVYSWKGDEPVGPGSSNRALVLNFGVAVKAKKLRFGCRARRSASRSTAALAPSERSSSSSSESCAAMAASIPSLFSMPLRAVAVSPPWDECASSTMTAKRLPAVSILTPEPFFPSVESAWEMKGNFWMVVMTMGVPLGKRLGELLGVLVDLLHHAGLVLELVNRRLQLLVQHAPVGHDDDGVEHLPVAPVVQAGQPVREPRDGVRLAGTGRMLDEVVPGRSRWPWRARRVSGRRRVGGTAGRSSPPSGRCARPFRF